MKHYTQNKFIVSADLNLPQRRPKARPTHRYLRACAHIPTNFVSLTLRNPNRQRNKLPCRIYKKALLSSKYWRPSSIGVSTPAITAGDRSSNLRVGVTFSFCHAKQLLFLMLCSPEKKCSNVPAYIDIAAQVQTNPNSTLYCLHIIILK